MKIIEIMGSLQLPLTNEEAELYEKFDAGSLNREDLTERENFVASNLVNKSVLTRKSTDGRITYSRSKYN